KRAAGGCYPARELSKGGDIMANPRKSLSLNVTRKARTPSTSSCYPQSSVIRNEALPPYFYQSGCGGYAPPATVNVITMLSASPDAPIGVLELRHARRDASGNQSRPPAQGE